MTLCTQFVAICMSWCVMNLMLFSDFSLLNGRKKHRPALGPWDSPHPEHHLHFSFVGREQWRLCAWRVQNDLPAHRASERPWDWNHLASFNWSPGERGGEEGKPKAWGPEIGGSGLIGFSWQRPHLEKMPWE